MRAFVEDHRRPKRGFGDLALEQSTTGLTVNRVVITGWVASETNEVYGPNPPGVATSMNSLPARERKLEETNRNMITCSVNEEDSLSLQPAWSRF